MRIKARINTHIDLLWPRLTALWLKEIIALSRDKMGLLALFIMPILFILIMTLALRDTFSPGASIDVAYTFVDLDHSPHSEMLKKRLARFSAFSRSADSPDTDTARASVLAGKNALALIVPAGFGERLFMPSGIDGQAATPLRLLVAPTLDPSLQMTFRSQTMVVLSTLRADELTRRAGQLFALPDMTGSNSEGHWPDDIESEAVRSNHNIALPSSVQQNVPAWLIFAMFFVVIPVSAMFVIERQQGTLQRLRAVGLPFHLVLAGKWLPFFIINQIQAVVMILVGIFVVPLFGSEALQLPSAWPQLLGGALVSIAVSLAAVAWALLIASLARTSEQATIIGGISNILMGAIGGIMVPRFVMPAEMQAMTELSPMAWGLEGFHTVMLRHGSLIDLLPSLSKLILFAILALSAAVWLNHRALAARI